MVFGEGSPYRAKFPSILALPLDAQERVTDGAVRAALAAILKALGDPPVSQYQSGVGAFGSDSARPSVSLDVLASEEVSSDLALALGYLLQQTAVRIEKVNEVRPEPFRRREGAILARPLPQRWMRELGSDFLRLVLPAIPQADGA